MINFRNKQLAAMTAIAGLGLGAMAVPAASLAASHPAHVKVTTRDPASPDKPGTKDGTSRDTKLDRGSSVDRSPSIDKGTNVDPKTDR